MDDDLPPVEDTVNWDPYSDSIFFNAMDDLFEERLYLQIEHLEQMTIIALRPRRGIPKLYVEMYIRGN